MGSKINWTVLELRESLKGCYQTERVSAVSIYYKTYG